MNYNNKPALMEYIGMASDKGKSYTSTAGEALTAAGHEDAAREISALDEASEAAVRKLASERPGLVERLIYGPLPQVRELQAGGRACAEMDAAPQSPVLAAALATAANGGAFDKNGRISNELRAALAGAGAYGLVVPEEFGGKAASYLKLAHLEEALSANGLGPVAVELSGQLTIGAGALLGYGSPEQQRLFLPLVAQGTLMAFALTEVGTGINAKKIGAYVETDAEGNYRLFADGTRNKLWITNASHGGLVAVAARIGRHGKELGLFVTRLPDSDIGSEGNWVFQCKPSGVDAFTANYNARLHFHDYFIPAANRIPGDGVEVLFYCLRMGRCMLAAMSAGYQRMLARDASNYAQQRQGVGGLVIDHELPRLAIARMLGGSLQSRALAYLALSQDATRADLAGLRDITKSAASQTALESMVACEHVMGGRAFHKSSRVNGARANLHLFGVVEGEDEMIRMAMVRDVTQSFANRYLAPLLAPLRMANTAPDGRPVPQDRRLLRLDWKRLWREPRRCAQLLLAIVRHPAPYRLAGWILRNAAEDLLRLHQHLLPSKVHPRYRDLPSRLRRPVRIAERELRAVRWRYLWLSLTFQLELATAQIALQRLGQQIEWLVSVVAICHHAACQDKSQQDIAALQAELLIEKVRAGKRGLGTGQLRRLREATAAVAGDVGDAKTSLFADLDAEPCGHPFNGGNAHMA